MFNLTFTKEVWNSYKSSYQINCKLKKENCIKSTSTNYSLSKNVFPAPPLTDCNSNIRSVILYLSPDICMSNDLMLNTIFVTYRKSLLETPSLS